MMSIGGIWDYIVTYASKDQGRGAHHMAYEFDMLQVKFGGLADEVVLHRHRWQEVSSVCLKRSCDLICYSVLLALPLKMDMASLESGCFFNILSPLQLSKRQYTYSAIVFLMSFGSHAKASSFNRAASRHIR